MQTLNDIASSLGVSLQTIYNRKADAEQRLGRKIEGTPHPTDKRKIVYDAEAVELITGHPGQAIEPVKAVEVTVESGNHCTALIKPEMSGLGFSLENFRADDVTALTFEDPADVATQFLAVADHLVGAMGEDIQQREQRLKATRDAQNKVAEKARELQLEQRLYRDRAKDLDTAQTENTQSLQDAIAALQSLGKPAGDAGDTSS